MVNTGHANQEFPYILLVALRRVFAAVVTVASLGVIMWTFSVQMNEPYLALTIFAALIALIMFSGSGPSTDVLPRLSRWRWRPGSLTGAGRTRAMPARSTDRRPVLPAPRAVDVTRLAIFRQPPVIADGSWRVGGCRTRHQLEQLHESQGSAGLHRHLSSGPGDARPHRPRRGAFRPSGLAPRALTRRAAGQLAIAAFR